MSKTDLALTPADEGQETLDDIASELETEFEAEQTAKFEAEIEAEIEPPKPPRAAGMIDGILSTFPSTGLNIAWDKFDLGSLTAEQVAALDAATLKAILTYDFPSMPQWLRDAVDKLLTVVGPFKDVIQLMAVFTMMQVYAKRAERARDVTPAKTPEIKPENSEVKNEN